MDFRQMRYLIAIAEHRSVSRAAKALYISQSALSHYIKYVEEDLGVRLFDRSTSPMSLTYAGECYVETARQILMANERLMKEVRDITRHMTGTLRLGAPRDRAAYMVPKLLPSFSARYPGIKVEVFTENGQALKEALRDGRADLLLLPDDGRGNEPWISAQTIYAEELLLAARTGVIPPSGLLKGKKAVRPAAMDKKNFFLQFQGHTTRAFCDSYFKRRRVRPAIGMAFPSNITCYRMAATGMGMAIIPFMITQLVRSSEGVELFSLGEKPETWNVQVLCRKDAYLGEPELDLIRIAKEVFAKGTLQSAGDVP